MLMWIVTSGVIGAFSVAALELFRETSEPCPSRTAAPAWDKMSEADLDLLMEEFSRAAGETLQPDRALAA